MSTRLSANHFAYSFCELLAVRAVELGEERIVKGMLEEIEYVPACDREGAVFADEI